MSKKFTAKRITTCGLVAALLCILGPLSIPIGPVPISLTNLVIYLSAFLLCPTDTLWSFLIYFLVGLCGLPVFSGFSAGFSKIMGPTGGYLIGFFFTAILSGLSVKYFPKNKILQFVGLFIATLIAYAFGTAWYIILTATPLFTSFTVCVLPFIPGDLIKIFISVYVGNIIKNRLNRNI